MQRQYSQSFQEGEEHHPKLSRQQSAQVNENSNSIFTMIVNHQLIKSIRISDIRKEVDKQAFNKKHYILYNVEIKTDYFDYTILRRYSEFLQLHDQLQHILELPKFPQKKLFRTNAKENITERRALLEKFLQTLLINLSHKLYKFLEFITIKEQFQKGGYGQNIRIHELSRDDSCLLDYNEANSKKFLPSNDQEKMVLHYICKLNERADQRGNIFSKMEKYFFGKMQFVSINFLRYLLVGDEDKNECGIIQLLHISSNDLQSHIACVSGMQFVRKLLEFDYNPYAELSTKAFQDVTMKQFKLMNIKSHISGTSQKLCKQDAMFILHKYVICNKIKDEFLKFLLEDTDTLDQYQEYALMVQQTKKEDAQFYLDSSDYRLSQSATKSTSKECAMILDLEPSIEQLEELYTKPITWKNVITVFGHSLYHIQGQFVKTTHPLSCSHARVLELFTSQKPSWVIAMTNREVVEVIDDSNRIVIENYVWETKQVYKKVVFISKETIEFLGKDITIKLSPITDPSKYENNYKNEELGHKVSLMHICFQSEDSYMVTILQNLLDKGFKQAYSPILLNETNTFVKAIEQLKSL